MKNNLIIITALSILTLMSCNTFEQKQKRKHNQEPRITEEQPPNQNAYETDNLIKRNLALVPEEKNCQNLKDFLENYQEKFLGEGHFVVYSPCTKDDQYVNLKGILVVSKDHKIDIKIGVSLNSLANLDEKVTGQAFISLSPSENFEPATRLAATFLKWAEENSFTARETCAQLEIAEERCLDELKQRFF